MLQEYSFWDLHVALQDAMGWLDYHLHGFRVVGPGAGGVDQIGIPDDDPFEGEVPRRTEISDILARRIC